MKLWPRICLYTTPKNVATPATPSRHILVMKFTVVYRDFHREKPRLFIDFSPGFQVAPHHWIFMESSWLVFMPNQQ